MSNSTTRSFPRSKMAEPTCFDRRQCLSLLRPPAFHRLRHIEQDSRSWTPTPFPFRPVDDCPLMRIRDVFTGDQPDAETGSMKSRSPRARLDTKEARRKSLVIHGDYEKWLPTSYLSFTISPSEVEIRGDQRLLRRGTQTLTIVNPNVRRQKGLPFINMEEEMEYYGVSDPYHRNNQYYHNEYLCLWEVTKEEVVGHYSWQDLRANRSWYHTVVLQDFKRHEERRVAAQSESVREPVKLIKGSIDVLTSAMSAISCKSSCHGSNHGH